MPYINITEGLTLRLPTKDTQNWEEEFRLNFATPISEHDHSGNGKGNKLGSAAINTEAINETHLRLQNDGYLRSRNQANTSDISILKINTSDELEIALEAKIDGLKNLSSYALVNNQAVAIDVTPILASSETVEVKYAILRLGTANLVEHGSVLLIYNGTDYDIGQISKGDSGVEFSVTSGGQLQYTSTNNAGSTSDIMHFQLERLG